MPKPQPMLTIDDICERLQVCRRTVTDWVNNNSFPSPVRINRRTFRWCAEEIDNFIATRPRAGAGAEK